MKKLLGFSLTTPMFFSLAYNQQFEGSTLYFLLTLVLIGMAMYGLMILEEIYTEERKRAKNEQRN
jgi:ABC-type Na+ efflux pump permease subunit